MSDFMSKEARSRVMASIKSKNTKPEKQLGSLMHGAGLRYRKHVNDLPGKPDFVFRAKKVAVFVDGDFWHGYKYQQWKHKLSKEYWIKKIEGNIKRDKSNHAKLRRMGWTVIRVWEHQLAKDPLKVLGKITEAIERNSTNNS